MLTELGRSQVEVQRCSLSSEGPRLRSSGAQCAQTLAVEVQQCPLHAEVGEELARRKWTRKWMQRWWRRSWRRGREVEDEEEEEETEEENNCNEI